MPLEDFSLPLTILSSSNVVHLPPQLTQFPAISVTLDPLRVFVFYYCRYISHIKSKRKKNICLIFLSGHQRYHIARKKSTTGRRTRPRFAKQTGPLLSASIAFFIFAKSSLHRRRSIFLVAYRLCVSRSMDANR